jgi:pimeloyl-ACP methyl ester carboxylesterase
MQVIVDDIAVYYQKVGKGPIVLLLHGWADSLNTFRHLEAGLQKHYTVISLDLPGFGKSEAPPMAWGLPEYSTFVSNFFGKIHPNKQLAMLVGHSNGGSIALYATARQLLKPEHLVLLASAGVRIPKSPRLALLKVVAKVGKVATSVLPSRAKHRLKHRFYKGIQSDYMVAEHLQSSFKKIVKHDLRADAGEVQVPCLLIYGSHDAQTPVWVGQSLAENLPNARLEVLPGIGHYLHHDAHQDVLKTIEEFAGL